MIQKRGFYMNVKIGKHIKELRNRDGVTQDALAEALGVTGQAISKWENESGYPDIEYITPIANFFNVTIDQLFGHDRSESENKINEYCEKLDELHRNWADVNTRIDLARQALAEFPQRKNCLFAWQQRCGKNGATMHPTNAFYLWMEKPYIILIR